MNQYDGGWSEALGHNMHGLFYTDTGGARQFPFDSRDLFCSSDGS